MQNGAAPAEGKPSMEWLPVLKRIPNDLEYLPPDDVVDSCLMCSVCLSWPAEPVVLGCPGSHILCQCCVDQLPERLCPVDRQRFCITCPAPAAVTARLDKLWVRCPYAAFGCHWTGVRDTVLDHVHQQCLFGMQECSACGKQMHRSECPDHLHKLRPGNLVTAIASNSDLPQGLVGIVTEADYTTATFVVNFDGRQRVFIESDLENVEGYLDHEARQAVISATSETVVSNALPHWASIETHNILLYHCAYVKDIAGLYHEADPTTTRNFKHKRTVVQLAPMPFGQGRMRTVSHALLNGEAPVVAKHLKSSELLISSDANAPPHLRMLSGQLLQSEISAVAGFLADTFSATQPRGKKVTILESYAAAVCTDQFELSGRIPFNLEDAISIGQFQRFSNRVGWWHPSADATLMRFTLWSYEVTRGHMMVANLKGVHTDAGWTLVDPCILCVDSTRFGNDNLGYRAMQCCLSALETSNVVVSVWSLGSFLLDESNSSTTEPSEPDITKPTKHKDTMEEVQSSGASSSNAPPCSDRRDGEAEQSSIPPARPARAVEEVPCAGRKPSCGAIQTRSVGSAVCKLVRAPRKAVTALLHGAICGRKSAKSAPPALPLAPSFVGRETSGTPRAAPVLPSPKTPSRMAPSRTASFSSGRSAQSAKTQSRTAPSPTGDDSVAAEYESVIQDLLAPAGSARSSRLPDVQIILSLLEVARLAFLSEPCLLELEAPLKILGDVHGQFTDLLRFFELGGLPPDESYLCLGDYVDRGKQSLETIVLLFALKVRFPDHVFLLRGNHESASINRIYGFYDECKRRYNLKLWRAFVDVFNCLPAVAVIDSKIFCCHGGPSPDIQSMEDIRCIQRPTDVPDSGVLCDLLWADPEKRLQGWCGNDRGISWMFGPDVVRSFCSEFGLDLIVRAHQVVEDGYEFFANRQLVTVFSAPNYCGEFDNSAAMLHVKGGLACTFQVLHAHVT